MKTTVLLYSTTVSAEAEFKVVAGQVRPMEVLIFRKYLIQTNVERIIFLAVTDAHSVEKLRGIAIDQWGLGTTDSYRGDFYFHDLIRALREKEYAGAQKEIGFDEVSRLRHWGPHTEKM